MVKDTTERRLAENEVIYRQFNERIFDSFAKLKEMAHEEGVVPPALDEKTPLYFFCECADEQCTQRIKLSPQEYKSAHRTRNRFIIICGHEVKEVEDIIEKKGKYCVVKKHKLPPKSAAKLHASSLDNT